MDHFAGLDVSVKETSVCIVDEHGQDRSGGEGSERARGSAAGTREVHLPVQADWSGSRTAVAVASQRTGRSGLTGDLCRDAAYAGGPKGADQQDGSQRRSRDGADDASWTLSSSACEDITQIRNIGCC